MANDAEDRDDSPRYKRPNEIDQSELVNALSGLSLFGDDMFLRMQAFNLAIIDQWLTGFEYEVLEKLIELEHTPIEETAFLSAQSQMWIFAAYEVMRTWRQRCRDVLKWSENGGLETKAKAFEKDLGYPHFARQMRADQLRKVADDPAIVSRIKDDLRLTHIPYTRMQAIRIAIAKHEVMGRKGAPALRPGYGRINNWSGSLDYELENGVYSMGFISRRDIADELRALSDRDDVPDDETINRFDQYMRGIEVPSFADGDQEEGEST